MDFTSRARATKISNSRRDTTKLLAKSIAGKSCPICLCVVEERKAAVIIPCFHAYCFECIRRWSNLKHRCPLCNADFDFWFTEINLASKTYRKVEIPINNDETVTSRRRVIFRPRRSAANRLRSFLRYREDLDVLNSSSSSGTRPLPWRRSFENRNEHPDDVAERVLSWRTSIYENRLQAVPIASRDFPLSKARGCMDAMRTALQSIEPWIRRELHAILRDPDPSVIVHVVTSLLISAYAEKHGNASQQELIPDFLAPLLPFLHERTTMFWHELRCFAESSLYMETYDCVVEYISLSD